jgi:magnesium chelatase family protein
VSARGFATQQLLLRISGPLLDRIDIHIKVPRVEYEKLSGDRLGESSAMIRERVEIAREIQRRRFAGGGGGGAMPSRSLAPSRSSAKESPLQANADMGPAEVRRVYCLCIAPYLQVGEAARK